MRRLVLALIVTIATVGCGRDLDARLSGEWTLQRAGQPVSIRNGLIVLSKTGAVFGEYAVLDQKTIRLTTRPRIRSTRRGIDASDGLDIALTVAFPDDTQMTWSAAQRANLYTFVRATN